ncbi:sulfite exporter TauE/SafE family protein [Legionella oakridgensis]|uniref:Probable membrane transporter protein n=2 Tax=Legionella oakridgensis TaxID=29423 RepID=W0BEZ9_9GAMM|nr:sulfite exporter TauE/SafE family protein [Legionella oakridgensis]AHE68445.1 putative permease [Legionella oakridgensis ATCC 33761 = DSM 21215]ETO92113.1 putative permease [Legionella oakridgensis RV-2-2007]KTD38400.1 permease [Legionella oakridgensis]STY21383.1 permease [Legionella longbeachae]
MILESITEHGTAYALTGAFAGFMSGTLGIGGGMIVVPALLYIFHHSSVVPQAVEMHVAAGTSLAIMIFTAMSSIRAHHRQGEILWSVYHRLWPGIVLGVFCGALLADQLSTYWLKILFGLFLLVISFKMMADIHVNHPRAFPGKWLNRLISFVIGLKSGLLGVGGGALIIPYLSFCGIDTRKIPAISALCTLSVAMMGTIAVIITGSNEVGLPAYSTGYVYWPAVIWVAVPSVLFAPIGAHLTYALPVQQLKYGLTAILLIAAIDMLI